MSEPMVSIAVCAHNAEATIKACLGSIEEQSYPHHQIEVVIVDDGSTDETRGRVNDWIFDKDYVDSTWGNIEILWGDTNCGVGWSRRTAELVATGKYIIYLDADDRLLPNAVSEAVGFMEERSDRLAAYSDHFDVDADSGSISIAVKLDSRALDVAYTLGHIRIIRRDLIAQVGYTDPEFRACEDWDLAYRISLKTKWHHIPRALCFKSRRVNSLTSDKDLMAKYTLLFKEKHGLDRPGTTAPV